MPVGAGGLFHLCILFLTCIFYHSLLVPGEHGQNHPSIRKEGLNEAWFEHKFMNHSQRASTKTFGIPLHPSVSLFPVDARSYSLPIELVLQRLGF
ncbi:uncharacterized protein BJ212DRAFT_192828 [Suillus subaureus]|uniref:Uncharacterized protein n=1 Tax=Suillus subaureus TaxID=48587 RepID=A0A9P7JDU0_9AGAM|nr:uncharacterized protein BJ212DRAFT_763317 [Suillus subaureus]XP_041193151.1 uncharacterized protein BJ212DRAFT_192828 [Suillus subaureus]KAG1793392.1 hypothetical protein BJ212DRAFT_763317 [Suillus subaureus]KAG1816478.1 hypothetical protein BJ212DRAFT_192828 [Suillus subaureus]